MSDLDDLATRVGNALEASGDVLATAESCTGGGIAETVTRRAGSSAWFDRAYITYSNDAKREMLGVSAETLKAHGAVSEVVAREMAEGALRGAATVAVAVSGVAGPGGGTDSKPVGMVCLAWAKAGGEVSAVTRRYRGDRAAVRRQAVIDALEGVIARVAPAGKARKT
ncbi:MAG TPA: nicotinamide-nucleotide amidohydrolase family protein [Gammaproteobacteria bacterium]|nr:nicotinamide-nucleotide amidohydrolase family protein [Gammaproteobacteria bacterium]